MFSLKAITLAEMKAKGTRGSLQRLRQSCIDAAGVFEETADLLEGKPLSRARREKLAGLLLRGANSLRAIAALNRPRR